MAKRDEHCLQKVVNPSDYTVQLMGSEWNDWKSLGNGSYVYTLTAGGAPTVVKKKTQFAVVNSSTGAVAKVCDTKDEAQAEARKLATKETEEFWVFGFVGGARPKPIDIEDISA